MTHTIRRPNILHNFRLYSVKFRLTLLMFSGMLLGCMTFLILPKDAVILDIAVGDWSMPLWSLFRMTALFLVVYVLQLLKNGDRLIALIAFIWGYLLDFALCCALLSGGFSSGAHFISEILSVPVLVWFFCGCAIHPCIGGAGIKFSWDGWGRRGIIIFITLVSFILIEQLIIKYFFT